MWRDNLSKIARKYKLFPFFMNVCCGRILINNHFGLHFLYIISLKTGTILSICKNLTWFLKVTLNWLPSYISIFIIEHLVCLDSPVCNIHPQLLGLSLGDKIDIPCRVSANPEDLTFHWFFNKTKDSKVNNNIVFHSR